MKCPYCGKKIGFLHFRGHFKCPFCNQCLVFKGVTEFIFIPEFIVSSIVYSLFSLFNNRFIFWVLTIIYVLLAFFLFMKNCHIEPDEDCE